MKIRKVPTLIVASLLASVGTIWARNPAQVETKVPLEAKAPLKATTPLEAKSPLPEKFSLSGVRIGERTSNVVAANGFPTHLLLSSESTNVTTLQVPFQRATILRTNAVPVWASTVSPVLDEQHTLWLYKRDTYTLAFQIDRLGEVDAVIVAGTMPSRTDATRLQDGKNAVDLGADLRKLMFLYGQPDTITSSQDETHSVRVFTLYYKSFAATIRDNRVVRLQLNTSAVSK